MWHVSHPSVAGVALVHQVQTVEAGEIAWEVDTGGWVVVLHLYYHPKLERVEQLVACVQLSQAAVHLLIRSMTVL